MAVQVRNDELVDLLAPDFLRRLDEIINARIIRALTSAGLRLEDDGGNLGITILDGGGVSIGDDSIATLADGTARAQITDTVGALLSLLRINSNAFGPSLELAKLKDANYAVVADGDRLGAVGFSGSDGTDSAWGAIIAAEVDGTPGNNDMPGRLIFYTTPDGSASPAEAARINNAGNLVMADGKRIETDEVRARDSGGLRLEDDGGNLGVFIEDGGQVGIATNTPAAALDIAATGDGTPVLRLSTERAWELQQGDSGGSAALILKNVVGPNKNFRIQTDGSTQFRTQDGSVIHMIVDHTAGMVRIGQGTDTPTSTNPVLVVDQNANTALVVRNSTGDLEVAIRADSTTNSVRSVSNHPLVFFTNNVDRGRFDTSGNFGVNTAAPTISSGVGIHLAGSTLRLASARTPASAGATGNAGEICWGSGFLHVCTGTNTWQRVALSTWP